MPARPALRLLLVEDNPRDARLVEIAFSELPALPHVLRRASSLKEAASALAQQPADLVLLDLGLPESQGLPTLTSMRQAAGTTPILVLTGQDDPDLQEDAGQLGARAFLSKHHLTPERLDQAVQKALG